ncbi:MAG: inositol monophosphatase family protein [Phycisphaerales bacterium]
MAPHNHTPRPADLAARLTLARQAADDAGTNAMRLYQSPALTASDKADGSPVTSADKEGETIIRRVINAQFPDDAILGEEFPETHGSSGYRWVIDPIDGTRSFIRGQPTFAVLIGIEHAGRVVGGVASFPALQETLWASAGAGAWWSTPAQGVLPAKVSTTSALQEAIVESLWPRSFVKNNVVPVREALEAATWRLRTWSDAYSWAMVATGRADAAVDFGSSLWDIAPFIIAITEAGGTITDWRGHAAEASRAHVASNTVLHESLLRITR